MDVAAIVFVLFVTYLVVRRMGRIIAVAFIFLYVCTCFENGQICSFNDWQCRAPTLSWIPMLRGPPTPP